MKNYLNHHENFFQPCKNYILEKFELVVFFLPFIIVIYTQHVTFYEKLFKSPREFTKLHHFSNRAKITFSKILIR